MLRRLPVRGKQGLALGTSPSPFLSEQGASTLQGLRTPGQVPELHFEFPAQDQPGLRFDVQALQDGWGVLRYVATFVITKRAPCPVEQLQVVPENEGQAFGHVFSGVAGKGKEFRRLNGVGMGIRIL